MFNGIFNLFEQIVSELSNFTMALINRAFDFSASGGLELGEIPFNLSLFSQTPIFTLNFNDTLLLFFNIFYTMFFIVLLYKVTKNIIKKVFGVFKI